MAVSREFLDFITDQLSPLGVIRVKRMFGGAGLYCDELFFAILDDEALYFKVDNENRAEFERNNLAPFTFVMKDGKTASMSYYSAPEGCLEDQDLLIEWAREGVAAALRAKQKKRKKTKRKQSGS